jgi:hypothetical protein
MARGKPPGLEWGSGEPDHGARVEARQVRRLHRLLAETYFGLGFNAAGPCERDVQPDSPRGSGRLDQADHHYERVSKAKMKEAAN